MSAGGEEYRIAHGHYTAVVTEVGGGLRQLRHDDRDLVVPYDEGRVRPLYRGALLVPWPNRVVDGRYTFDGVEHQLPLTEPEHGHALHGLVAWERFEPREVTPGAVTLAHRIVPQAGYPFSLEVVVRYALDDDGLTTTVVARNTGEQRAPYGVGSHPYLVAGPGAVDDWTLELPADRVMQVTADRLAPVGLTAVADTALDFRERRRIGSLEVDHAFTGLAPGRDGQVRARVLTDDGTGVGCRWDPAALPWVQVHTADRPAPEPSRLGLALEPMSCAPDAFSSGLGLVVLEPGGEHHAQWTVAAV
jgi:aldose 1-epimerase